jgi:hypothetical protein
MKVVTGYLLGAAACAVFAGAAKWMDWCMYDGARQAVVAGHGARSIAPYMQISLLCEAAFWLLLVGGLVLIGLDVLTRLRASH